MRSLYLIRHGEPAKPGVFLGRVDSPLSLAGVEQMRALEVPAEVFYTSELRRARVSAELCSRGRPVIVLSELTEMTMGEWDGKSWSEIEHDAPDLAHRKLEDWMGVTVPGGETWDDFTARVDRGLRTIVQADREAAVVAHLTVNSWLAHRLSGTDPLSFTQEYGQIYKYEI